MGLGNQMFQYAAGRSLSLRNNCPLKLDVRSYAGYTIRKYELETFFDLQVAKASPGDLEDFIFAHPVKRVWNKVFPQHKMRQLQLPYEERQLKRLLLKTYDVLYPPHKRKIYTEREYYFDKHFHTAVTPIYLQGYWMTWRYFEHIEDIIKKDFTIKRELVKHLTPVAHSLQQENSI